METVDPRPTWKSKEFRASVAALVVAALAMLAGDYTWNLDNLKELIPLIVLIVGALKGIFSSSGRVKLEQQNAGLATALTQQAAELGRIRNLVGNTPPSPPSKLIARNDMVHPGNRDPRKDSAHA